jgi:uncharacterized RDD family membrane protein YckC
LSLLLARPIAYFIDFLMLWCICIIPQLLAYQFLDGAPFKYFTEPLGIYFWVMISVSFPLWAYFIITEKSKKQATLGKRILGLKVQSVIAARIDIKESLFRTAIKLLPWEIAHLGLLPVYEAGGFQPDQGQFEFEPNLALYLSNAILLAFTIYFIAKKGKLTIHDRISGTEVVKV